MVHIRASSKLHRDLLIALESARTRLAVAIASETKSTPPDRLRYYLETADRARRMMKKLRRSNFDTVQEREDWIHVLETLKQFPVQEPAALLCERLGNIIVQLE